jgi:putative phosphoribosyl transferase
MRRKLVLADRLEAGRLLGERLATMALARPIVLALPRGGVPVGAEIARILQAPLDVTLVRKIGAPHEPELAIGAVAEGPSPEIVVNEEVARPLGISDDFIASEAAREYAIIAQRRNDYAPWRPTYAMADRIAIVVDDGVATGMTMQAALRSVRRRGPARLIAAVPVASREALAMLRREADEVVCLSAPGSFGSVGAFYRDFAQVSDAEVIDLLRQRRG